ncbi:MAG: hypothetical protein ACE5FA_13910, partial [Dehalococcoidia bacterium]
MGTSVRGASESYASVACEIGTIKGRPTIFGRAASILDGMAEEVLDVEGRTEDDPPAPPRKIVLDMPSWVPSEKVPRGLLIVTL